jgi:peptidoglycan hydrolase-like protein with peptidoglycan-binding domain
VNPLFSPAERAAPVEAAPRTLSGRTKRFASIVRRVQIALTARQLYHGALDGVVGPKLRAALRTFQGQRSLTVTGTITPETLDALMVASG